MNGVEWVIAPIVACFSFGAWLILQRRYRLSADMPTSTVGGAVQGYVELQGVAAAHPAAPLYSPLRALPCVWYHYCVQEKQGDKWKTVRQETSDATFLLRDGSGLLERAVRLVFKSRVEGRSLWSAIESVAAKVGCAPQTLNAWVK